MRPAIVTVTGIATSPWITVDYRQSPFAVGLGVVVSATATYTVQHTFDDINDPLVAASAVAFPHSVLSGIAANADGNYAFPVRGIRLNVTASTGTVKMTVLQGQR